MLWFLLHSVLIFWYLVTDRKIGLKVDPRSGSLVVPVFPHGRLQFYNPEKDSVLSTVSFSLEAYAAYGTKDSLVSYFQRNNYEQQIIIRLVGLV